MPLPDYISEDISGAALAREMFNRIVTARYGPRPRASSDPERVYFTLPDSFWHYRLQEAFIRVTTAGPHQAREFAKTFTKLAEDADEAVTSGPRLSESEYIDRFKFYDKLSCTMFDIALKFGIVELDEEGDEVLIESPRVSEMARVLEDDRAIGRSSAAGAEPEGAGAQPEGAGAQPEGAGTQPPVSRPRALSPLAAPFAARGPEPEPEGPGPAAGATGAYEFR